MRSQRLFIDTQTRVKFKAFGCKTSQCLRWRSPWRVIYSPHPNVSTFEKAANTNWCLRSEDVPLDAAATVTRSPWIHLKLLPFLILKNLRVSYVQAWVKPHNKRAECDTPMGRRRQLYLSVCCVQSPRGTAHQGTASRRCSPRIVVCSPRTSSLTGSASSGTPVTASPAAQSPCSTGQYLMVHCQEKHQAGSVRGISRLQCTSFRNICSTWPCTITPDCYHITATVLKDGETIISR